MFYNKLANNKVQCLLCPRECIIYKNERGFCGARENREGKLYSIVYGKPCVADVGPIEKAPIFHYIPGHKRLCVATVGCNLRCPFCQNWHISQANIEDENYYELSPEEIIKLAKQKALTDVSFTYTEPTVFYEYIYDIAKLAKSENIMVSIVSNGYINPEPLKELAQYLTAIKIDLKAFTDNFYDELGAAKLSPVLNTLKLLKQQGIWVEIVNLIIPTKNDNPADIKKMCQWIKENLGDTVPLHFTRFYPAYKLRNLPPTPIETLEMAYKIAKQCGLKYVYIGNVPGHKYENTYCHNCGKLLIRRIGFSILENNIKNGKCSFCKTHIPGIWR